MPPTSTQQTSANPPAQSPAEPNPPAPPQQTSSSPTGSSHPKPDRLQASKAFSLQYKNFGVLSPRLTRLAQTSGTHRRSPFFPHSACVPFPPTTSHPPDKPPGRAPPP